MTDSSAIADGFLDATHSISEHVDSSTVGITRQKMELPRDYDKKTKESDVDGKDLLGFKSSESNDTDVKDGEGNKTKLDVPVPKTPEKSTTLSLEISGHNLSDNKSLPKAIIDIHDPKKESNTSGTFDEFQSEIDNTATGFILNLYKDYKG